MPEKGRFWTKPDDLEIDDKAPLTGLAGSPREAFLAAFADGSVRTFPDSIDLTVFRALLTKDGGEAVQAPVSNPLPNGLRCVGLQDLNHHRWKM